MADTVSKEKGIDVSKLGELRSIKYKNYNNAIFSKSTHKRQKQSSETSK